MICDYCVTQSSFWAFLYVGYVLCVSLDEQFESSHQILAVPS